MNIAVTASPGPQPGATCLPKRGPQTTTGLLIVPTWAVPVREVDPASSGQGIGRSGRPGGRLVDRSSARAAYRLCTQAPARTRSQLGLQFPFRRNDP